MCDLHGDADHLRLLEDDDRLDTPRVRELVATARAENGAAASPADGAMTPVHDHLAWGRGNRDEEFHRPGAGRMELLRRRPLSPGDFYALPSRDDIHRVCTTSPVTSVSIHRLANDTGCVWRHRYDETTGEAAPLRPGYVNADCDGTESPRSSAG